MTTADVLVVGVGDFGRLHAAVAADGPATRLTGVVDLDLELAAEVARAHGANAAASIDEAVTAHRPDVAVVATPEHLHVEHTTQLLAHRIPVLVEKPVSLDPADVDVLEIAARHAGVPVLPGHVSRFIPEVALLLQRVEQPRSVVASRLVPHERRGPHGRIHPAWMAMIHDLDLVAALLPDGPVTVTAASRRRDDAGENPDQCWAMLACDGGPVALVENVWLLPHARQYIDARLRVIDDQGVHEVRTPASDGFVTIAADGEHRPALAVDGRIAGQPVGALGRQLQHLVDVSRGAAPLVTLRDARRAGLLAQAVVASSTAGGEPVQVSLT